MNEDILKVALYLFKKEKAELNELEKLTEDVKSVLKYLESIGWVKKKNNTYKFTAEIDTIVRSLLSDKSKMDIPFIGKIYSATNAYFITIPAYIVRALGLQKGDLLVIRKGDVRISGTLSGSKNLFYIHKKFWDKLNLQKGAEEEFIIEAIYKSVKNV